MEDLKQKIRLIRMNSWYSVKRHPGSIGDTHTGSTSARIPHPLELYWFAEHIMGTSQDRDCERRILTLNGKKIESS